MPTSNYAWLELWFVKPIICFKIHENDSDAEWKCLNGNSVITSFGTYC